MTGAGALAAASDTVLLFPDRTGITAAMTQEKALDALTGLPHVLCGGLAGANEIAHRLMRFVRHPDQSKFASAREAGLRANSGGRATSRGASRSYAARRRVKPGINRWAQINGLRGDLGPVGKLKQRVEHDIKDIENKDIEKQLISQNPR